MTLKQNTVIIAAKGETFKKNYYIYFVCLPDDGHKFCRSILHCITILKPTCHVMHHQFNIQQLYVLRTLYLCVLCLSENKQRLVPFTA